MIVGLYRLVVVDSEGEMVVLAAPTLDDGVVILARAGLEFAKTGAVPGDLEAGDFA